ncbi:MAG: DNA recombination protein RmuC [Dissulfurispiraceae bacterium]|jgi:DNA recombination protein RmuC
MTYYLLPVFLLIGTVTGAVVAWFIAIAKAKSAEAIVGELRHQLLLKEQDASQIRAVLDTERHQRIETVTRLEESHKRLEDSHHNLEQQKELVEVMKKEISDTFSVLSSAALKSSSEDFLRLASENLGKIVADTKGKLGEHQAAMDGTIKPLQEMLKRYEQQLRDIEENRHRSFGSLTEQLRSLSTMHEQLQRETSSLVTALRRPKASGSWGELGLRRVVELAGMTAYCDFYEQESVSTDSGRLRPDMIVRLPNGREIVIDAKAPVDAYMNVVSAASEDERKKAIANYISNVRNHMNALSSKAYWDQFDRSPEIVVMYLPGESFFSAAIEHDHALIEDGSVKRVVLATPTTLIALLKAIAYGWQQEQVAKSAQEINKLGKDLYERFSIMLEHYSKTGLAIRKAVESYNEGVRSVESRLIPSIKKFKELGVSSSRDIVAPVEISEAAKSIEHLVSEFEEEEKE